MVNLFSVYFKFLVVRCSVLFFRKYNTVKEMNAGVRKEIIIETIYEGDKYTGRDLADFLLCLVHFLDLSPPQDKRLRPLKTCSQSINIQISHYLILHAQIRTCASRCNTCLIYIWRVPQILCLLSPPVCLDLVGTLLPVDRGTWQCRLHFSSWCR